MDCTRGNEVCCRQPCWVHAVAAPCPALSAAVLLLQAISMIAFVGQNRSEARYAASNEAYLTQGVGVVTQTALIVNWSKPALLALAGGLWLGAGSAGCCWQFMRLLG